MCSKMEYLIRCFSYACPYDPNALDFSQTISHQTMLEQSLRTLVEEEKPLLEKPLQYTKVEVTPCTLPALRSCSLSTFHFACPSCRLRLFRRKLRLYLQKKPYSAVSVQIDRMSSEQYEEDDLSGIVDLIEVIRIQPSGPTEAARAIRKKL